MNNWRQKYIDRTARKPWGKKMIKRYKNPIGHYKSFKLIIEKINLKKDDIFLEIGCGGGALIERVFKEVKKLYAIDHSTDMIKISKERNNQEIADGRVEIVQGDAEELPWTDNKFSCVGCANVFFFIKQPKKMLSEVYRVLKPGGRFAMVTAKKGFLSKYVFRIYSLKLYTIDEIKNMLIQTGFKNIEIKPYLIWDQLVYAEKI